MRLIGYTLALLATLAVVSAAFWASGRYFRSEELQIAQGRLSLYQSTVRAELQRFSHLTFVLAQDPFVISAATSSNREILNDRFRNFAQQAGLEAIYLMSRNGRTIAASNAGQPNSFIGQNYGFRPYFLDAAAGAQGRFYGIGATTGLPGYFIANPVTGQNGMLLGVIAIKIDLSALQSSWREAGENVLLTNQDGIVLLSSDPDWRYRALHPLGPEQRAHIKASRQFPGQPLAALNWQQTQSHGATINGQNWLYVSSDDLPHDWQLHYFASDDSALAKSWLVAGLALMIAASALIAVQTQRTRRIGAALRRSEEEEAALRRANDQLAKEIDDRRTAERRLRRTQAELENASRLAALGRLAASVTHELGQPIAAMRNHLTAAEITVETTGKPAPLAPITGLVERMEGITRQLKFFARNDGDEMGTVDLRAAMAASLDLVTPNLHRLNVTAQLSQPDKPVLVRGNRLRLEQVMTNLLRNALDAMEDSRDPALCITIGAARSGAFFEVADRGHGLGCATLAQLQEPFFTTRESGRDDELADQTPAGEFSGGGMGLGLAISAGILQDHNAQMQAQNRPQGGARFLVRFPPYPDLDADNQPRDSQPPHQQDPAR